MINSRIASKSERTKVTRMCNFETNREEKNSITYNTQGKEYTSTTYGKEETGNAHQEETFKARDGYISIHKYGKRSDTQCRNICAQDQIL